MNYKLYIILYYIYGTRDKGGGEGRGWWRKW